MRRTCALAFLLFAAGTVPASLEAASPEAAIPPMPEAFSSFGAAAADDYVYVYGGHIAKTHNYSTDAVTGKFRRLNLRNPKAGWEELPAGQALQGLALVAHGGKIYRIGGMAPKNKPDEKADNHSTATCAVYDPKTAKWSDLPALAAARSSHDAAVVGDQLIVIGGWNMRGRGEKPIFHEDTLILDLSAKTPKWESMAQPFKRRAFNVGAANGKVFVVGGMNDAEEVEKTVNVFDPKAKAWSTGPELPGANRNGFGPAVIGAGNKVFASPADGKIYRLADLKDGWSEVGALETRRIVHRLVPAGERLLALGGATREANLASVETIEPKLVKDRPAQP